MHANTAPLDVARPYLVVSSRHMTHHMTTPQAQRKKPGENACPLSRNFFRALLRGDAPRVAMTNNPPSRRSAPVCRVHAPCRARERRCCVCAPPASKLIGGVLLFAAPGTTVRYGPEPPLLLYRSRAKPRINQPRLARWQRNPKQHEMQAHQLSHSWSDNHHRQTARPTDYVETKNSTHDHASQHYHGCMSWPATGAGGLILRKASNDGGLAGPEPHRTATAHQARAAEPVRRTCPASHTAAVTPEPPRAGRGMHGGSCSCTCAWAAHSAAGRLRRTQ